jgi:hypothetical protein
MTRPVLVAVAAAIAGANALVFSMIATMSRVESQLDAAELG